MSQPTHLWLLCGLSLAACTAKSDPTDDTAGYPTHGDDTGAGTTSSSADAGATTADGGSTATGMLPAKPDPFTLHITGGANLDLYFDTPTCSAPVGGSNFRSFWRDSTGSHVFVLVADLLGTFTKAGTYDTANDGAKIKLQEEAGGSGDYAYYATDESQGDSATVTVDYIDEEKLEIAWGEFTISGLHGSSGPQLNVTPQAVPIWCDALN